jgi:hypothetical protein
MPDHALEDRELWRQALAATAACPLPEELVRVSREVASENAAIRAHVEGCVQCQTELVLLKEFQSAATDPGEAAAVSWVTAELERRFERIVFASSAAPVAVLHKPVPWYRRFDRRPFRVAALTAAGLLILLGVGLNLRGVQEPELNSSAAGGSPVLRSDELIALAPVGDVKRPPTELRWQAAPGAAHYLVKVMEVDRTELWKSESTETSISLPAAIRKAIVPGKSLLWQVTAVGADQRTLGSSKTVSFRLPVRAGSSKD